MKHLIIILLASVLPVAAQTPEVDSTGTVQIHVTGFRNNEGIARITLFRGKIGFPNDSNRAYWKGVREIDNDEIKIHVAGVEYGTYAVSVYHDANSNGKLDRKWHIIPEEGFGSSNNTREEKQGPSFRESAFEVDSDSTYITIEIEYLFGK